MRIPKAIMDPMGNRPPNSDRDPFLGASLALGTALELLLGPPTAPITAGCIKSTFCHVIIQWRSGSLLLHRIRDDDTLK